MSFPILQNRQTLYLQLANCRFTDLLPPIPNSNDAFPSHLVMSFPSITPPVIKSKRNSAKQGIKVKADVTRGEDRWGKVRYLANLWLGGNVNNFIHGNTSVLGEPTSVACHKFRFFEN